MPVGKNSIKRVANNGYSNVKTEAPDMENSVVAEPTNAQEKKPVAKKASTKKSEPKKASPKAESVKKKAAPTPKKSMESEPDLSPVKTLEKVAENTAPEKEGYTNLGREMPYYLL